MRLPVVSRYCRRPSHTVGTPAAQVTSSPSKSSCRLAPSSRGPIYDPDLAAEAHRRGIGSRFEARFNRAETTNFSEPYTAPATVLTLTDGRCVGAVIFAGVPSGISLSISADPIIVDGVPVATDKLVAALVATLCIAVVGAFYRYSRTGVALQALADDRQTAMSVGIDIDHHLLIIWMIAGVISVAAGVLWTFVSGGGFVVALVGLKVFPIVIIGGLDSILGAILGAMIIGV